MRRCLYSTCIKVGNEKGGQKSADEEEELETIYQATCRRRRRARDNSSSYLQTKKSERRFIKLPADEEEKRETIHQATCRSPSYTQTRPQVRANMSTSRQQIRVRWEGNGSTRFDGVTQDIALKLVVPEDAVTIRVGGTVRVKWGRGSRARFWKGVVVSTDVDQPLSRLPTPSPPWSRGRGRRRPRPRLAVRGSGHLMLAMSTVSYLCTCSCCIHV